MEREKEREKRQKEFRLWTEKEILESETELETGIVDKDFGEGSCGIQVGFLFGLLVRWRSV